MHGVIRTRLTATALASGLLLLAAAPAVADSPAPTPTVTHTPSASPAPQSCPFDVKAVAATKGVIAEVVVRQPARALGPRSYNYTTYALPIRIDSVIKGQAAKGPATLVVSGATAGECGANAVVRAKPKDQLLVVGTFKGTRLDATIVTSADHACAVKEALGQVCPATFEALNPPATQPWLKIAAPGLAAIITATLGLLLLRLRRR